MLDTHCHIDLFLNPELALIDIDKSGLKVVSVTNLPSNYEVGLPYYDEYKSVIPSLGFHPLLVDSKRVNIENEILIFKRNVVNAEFIGEVGLDYTVDSKHFLLQKEVFYIATRMAKFFGKPLSVHSRNASKDVLEILIRNRIQKVILHWFTGTINEMRMAQKHGYYFSINKKMINTKKGRELISNIDPNLILVESDAPFTSTSNSVYPIDDLREVYLWLSDLWELSFEGVAECINENYGGLLKKQLRMKVA